METDSEQEYSKDREEDIATLTEKLEEKAKSKL